MTVSSVAPQIGPTSAEGELSGSNRSNSPNSIARLGDDIVAALMSQCPNNVERDRGLSQSTNDGSYVRSSSQSCLSRYSCSTVSSNNEEKCLDAISGKIGSQQRSSEIKAASLWNLIDPFGETTTLQLSNVCYSKGLLRVFSLSEGLFLGLIRGIRFVAFPIIFTMGVIYKSVYSDAKGFQEVICKTAKSIDGQNKKLETAIGKLFGINDKQIYMKFWSSSFFSNAFQGWKDPAEKNI